MILSDQQRRNLEYFKNKICTVITTSINRNFEEKTLIDYFVGKITKIDEAGLWYEHVQTKCLNFVFFNQLIGIAEEKVINDVNIVSKVLEERPKIQMTPQYTHYPMPSPTPLPKKVITVEQLRKEASPPSDLDALKNLLNGS